MNAPKIPQELALKLALLHDLVMETQEVFDYFKNQLYGDDFDDCETENYGLNNYDIDELTEEIESICERLDDLESETSELDCEYNNYDC